MDISAFSNWLKSVLPDNYYQMYLWVSDNPWVQGLIVISVFAVIALPVRMIIFASLRKSLSRVGYSGDLKHLASLERAILYSVIGAGFIVALSLVGNSLTPLGYLRPVILTFLCLSWMFVCLGLAGAFITFVANRAKEGASINKRTEPIIHISVNVLVIFVWVYALLLVWDINPMGLLASAGVFGIALGFAAKDTLANLFAGFFIIVDSPYQVGDYITLESGERGKVTQIGFRSTRLITRDDIEVIVPNGVIGNGKVVNETRGGNGLVRVRVSVQASYSDPLDAVSETLLSVGLQHEEVCKYPAARVRVRGFADSGVDIQLLCWVNNPELRGRVTHELYLATKTAFDDRGFEIPYPKQDVYLKPEVTRKVEEPSEDAVSGTGVVTIGANSMSATNEVL